MKHYLIFIFSDACTPLQDRVTHENTFHSFDSAFEALEAIVKEEWPEIETVPPPRRPGPFNFSHKGDHFQIWESNAPANVLDYV